MSYNLDALNATSESKSWEKRFNR